MHHGQPRFRVGLRAGALLVHAALVAACGHRSVQVSGESCEGQRAPVCMCAPPAQTPACVNDVWHCPPCVSDAKDAGTPQPPPDAALGSDASIAPEVGSRGEADAGDNDGRGDDGGGDDGRGGCHDGWSLVCRRGCGDHVREWRPTCEGDSWQCRWGGSLEERSTPPVACD